MNSFTKLTIGFAVLLVFATSQLNAQKSASPELLIGEWTKTGKSGHQINDTIILTKQLTEASKDHPRWKFKSPDKLSQGYAYKSNNGAISLSQAFKWNYDKKAKLLRIQGPKTDQYYKIVPTDYQTINLICIK